MYLCIKFKIQKCICELNLIYKNVFAWNDKIPLTFECKLRLFKMSHIERVYRKIICLRRDIHTYFLILKKMNFLCNSYFFIFFKIQNILFVF